MNQLLKSTDIAKKMEIIKDKKNIRVTTSEASLFDFFMLVNDIEGLFLKVIVNKNSLKNGLSPSYSNRIKFNLMNVVSYPKFDLISKYELIIDALESKKIEIKEYVSKKELKARSYRFDNKLLIGSSGFYSFENIDLDIETKDEKILKEYDEWFDETFNSNDSTESNEKFIELISSLSEPLSKEQIFTKIISKLFDGEWEETKTIMGFMKSDWYQKLWPHQKIAVAKALKAFENDDLNTFMIADEVGLGKTAIAVSLAAYYSLFARGGIKVIAPKNIVKNNWDNFKRINIPPFNKPIDMNATSVSDLSREKMSSEITKASFTNVKLLIIDESQYLKNDKSGRSERFWNITREAVDNGMKVLLLTATPISNNLMELFNQLNLGKENYNDRNIKNLFKKQDKELKEVKNDFSFNEALVRYIQSRVISRTKVDLKLRNPNTKIPDLNKNNVHQIHFDSYENEVKIIELLNNIGASSNHRKLIKFGFFKRLEESLESLRSSINKGTISISKLLEDEEWEIKDWEESSFEIKPNEKKEINNLIDIAIQNDSKTLKLIEIIKREKDRFIVFSSSIKTIEYIYNELINEFPNKKIAYITGQGHKSNYSEKYNQKDLIYLSSKKHNLPSKEKLINEMQIDILVVSNAYAEGQNLQSFKRVVNYDITWNPMILQQRLGRIYRLNSDHEEIHLYNFWPSKEIKEYLGLHQKMFVKTSKSMLVSDLPDIFGFKDEINTNLKKTNHEEEAKQFERSNLSILNELNPIDIIQKGSQIEKGWYSILEGPDRRNYNLFKQTSTNKYFFIYTNSNGEIKKDTMDNLMQFKKEYNSFEDLNKRKIYSYKKILNSFNNDLKNQIIELNKLTNSIKRTDKKFELVSSIFIIKK